MKGNIWNVFDYLTDSLTFTDGLNKTARVAKDGLNRIVTDLVKDKKNLKAVNKLISFDFSKIVGEYISPNVIAQKDGKGIV